MAKQFLAEEEESRAKAKARWIAVGGVVVLAAGIGRWVSAPEPDRKPREVPAPEAALSDARPRFSVEAARPAEASLASDQDTVGGDRGRLVGDGRRPIARPIAREEIPVVPVKIPRQERLALQRTAREIERRANHEVERLAPALDLSPSQQDQVFALLVRRSPGFDPLMVTVGSDGARIGDEPDRGESKREPDAVGSVTETPSRTGPDGGSDALAPEPVADPEVASEPDPETATAASPQTVQDEILEVLTPDQAVLYIESEADRVAWWGEILDHIAATTDVRPPEPAPGSGYGGSIPEPSVPVTGTPVSPRPPAAYGGP